MIGALADAAGDGQAAVTSPVMDRLTRVLEHLPAGTRPTIQPIALPDLLADPTLLENVNGGYADLSQISATDRYELYALAGETNTPMLILCESQAQIADAAHDPGVIATLADQSDQQVATMLRAMLGCSQLLDDVTRELRLMSAHRDGLSQQITKLDEELRMAAQLQREFLPSEMPTIGNISFNALWRPAGYVSGDIYDVFRVDEHHVAFFVADAVGHGVPAALMTIYIKRCLMPKSIDESSPGGYHLVEPGDVLGKLNRDILAQQAGKVRFATACYGMIDTRTNVLKFARAGHPYPMVLRADGGTDMLEPDGGLLGVFPEETFETQTVELVQGDRLLVYSDGFEVAFPVLHQPADKSDQQAASGGTATKARGKAKVGKVANDRYTVEFQELRNGTPKQALHALADKLNLQAGSLNQRDDLTVLCVDVAHDAA